MCFNFSSFFTISNCACPLQSSRTVFHNYIIFSRKKLVEINSIYKEKGYDEACNDYIIIISKNNEQHLIKGF